MRVGRFGCDGDSDGCRSPEVRSTVQSYLMQSFQKVLTENFFLMTTVSPARTVPTPRIPPAVWYSGSGTYGLSVNSIPTA